MQLLQCSSCDHDALPDLAQLRELQLIDDAVRGGGLGALLKRYMQLLHVSMDNETAYCFRFLCVVAMNINNTDGEVD